MSNDKQLLAQAVQLTIHSGQLTPNFIKKFSKYVTNIDASDHKDAHVEAILLETLPDEHTDLDNEDDHKPILERTFFHESEAESLLNNDLLGRYKIKSILESDRIGQWFLAHDTNCDRDVHVRFLKPKFDDDPKQLKRFTNEAKVLAKLTHPGIPTIHEMNLTEGGAFYYTCSPIFRNNLKQLRLLDNTTSTQSITLNNLIDIMISACDIIGYAHKVGIYHQDLKPEHLRIDKNNNLLITGWSNTITAHDQISLIAGTPLYMSPEQARIERSDHLSDIYCLGSTFYHLLTKNSCVQFDELEDFWQQKRNGDYTILDTELPDGLKAIINKSLSPTPDQRYQSTTELADDLRIFRASNYSSNHKTAIEHPTTLRVGYKTVITLCLLALLLFYTLNFTHLSTTTEQHNQWSSVHTNNWQHSEVKDLDLDWVVTSKGNQALSQNKSFKMIKGTLSVTNNEMPIDIAYRQIFAHNMELSWIQKLSKNTNITCFVSGDSSARAYAYTISNINNILQISLHRKGLPISQTTYDLTTHAASNVTFKLRNMNGLLTLHINGQSAHRYQDPLPLSGTAHSQLGFTFPAHSNAAISNVIINRQALPDKTSPLSIANHYFQLQEFDSALAQLKIYQAGDSAEHEKVDFMLAQCHAGIKNHNAAIKGFQYFIQTHSNSELMPYALYHYMMTLCKNKQWDSCNETLISLHHQISPALLKSTLMTELDRIVTQDKTLNSPSLSALKTTIKTLR